MATDMEIALTQNQICAVDESDYALLSQREWYAVKNVRYYAACMEGTKVILMHRFITGVTDPKVLVDHRNGNTLDNRRINLRSCDDYQSAQNRGMFRHNTSGFKGVTKTRNGKRWLATIRAYGKDYYVGTYDTPEEASEEWKKAALKYHGDFANLT